MNLKELRKKKKITQEKLAKELNVSRSTISMWETGTNQPDNATLIDLSKILDVTVDEILGLKTGKRKSGVRIPVYGSVAAGIPLDAIEDIIDYEEISEDMARTGEFIALQVKGHSMEPTISNKDVVIVRLQPDVENGEIAVVLVNGDEATCKKIKKRQDGVMLIPLNQSYEPMFYSNEEIETLPVRILGKVVECRKKF